MQALLDRILARFVAIGTLDVTWPNGATRRYQGAPGPHVAMRIATPAAIRALILRPAMAMGECYMDGSLAPLDPADGTGIAAFLDLVGVNVQADRGAWPGIRLYNRLTQLRRRIDQHNDAASARRNVAHHYDLSGELYGLFLDTDRQYSCAYFTTGEETLEQAQADKKAHIAAKLRLGPGLRVLDIGCGWGGLALTLATDHGVDVTGITLSAEQHAEATARAAAANLSDRVRFRLADYRTLTGSYDRIVSVGMFEHVGLRNYPAYFATLRRCLAPDGVALLHTIGLTDGAHATNAWIRRYIFPGGYSPALSEIMPPLEASGLIATDIEILRLHYAITLSHWRRRFATHRSRIATLYDDRFCRMFEFYLALSETAFRRLTHVNFQIQLTRTNTAVPLTRGYMGEREGQGSALDPSGPGAPNPQP